MKPAPAKADLSHGGVVINAQGAVLLREPSNHYGKYVWTFAKGRADTGETPEQAALREVREETGCEAEVVAPIDSWFTGTTGATYFWLMRPVRDLGWFHWETAAVCWVPLEDAPRWLAQTQTLAGRTRDLAVLAAARSLWTELTALP